MCVCVCVCVCVCACVRACMRACVRACMLCLWGMEVGGKRVNILLIRVCLHEEYYANDVCVSLVNCV